MRFRPEMVAVLALVGLTACQEPPSYRLRWVIDGRERLDATACAESGLFQVRLRAWAGPDQLADERTYPCDSSGLDDSEGTVGGSALPPGRYAIELRGLDRTGDPWDEAEVPSLEPNTTDHPGCTPDADVIECRPNELVCDCQHLVVVTAGASASEPDATDATVVEDGATTTLPEFVLVPPPQCVDGIDNDRDGLVDTSDPSCNVDFGDGTEGVPVGVTELRLELTLLEGLVKETCLPEIGGIQVWVDTEETGSLLLFEDSCKLGEPYFVSTILPAGPARFSVIGYRRVCDEQTCGDDPYCMGSFPQCFPSYCGYWHEICSAFHLTREACFGDGGFSEEFIGANVEECTQPRDQPDQVVTKADVETFDAEISPLGGTLEVSVDFGSNDFISPIVSEARLRPGYVSGLGRQTLPRYKCEPPPINSTTTDVTRGYLTIASLRMEVLNSHGGPLDVPITLDDGTILDGSTALDCTEEFVTEDLTWGGYAVEIEALSAAGDVCFSNAGMAPLVGPGQLETLFVSRIYGPDGKVPTSCRECDVDADCGLEDVLFCREGVCQGRCSTDEECLSSELGDLGHVCIDGVCQRAT